MSITIRVPTGLPDPSGRPEWTTVSIEHVPGKSLAEYLDLPASQIMHVIYEGAVLRPEPVFRPARETAVRRWARRILTPWRKPPGETASDIERCIPRDGDAFVLLTRMGGKNRSVILGVIGAVIGMIAAPGNPWSLAGLQGAMMGYSIGSMIGALITPKPKVTKPGDDANSSYVWGGITNEDRAGVAVPVIFGRHRVGGVRISTFVRRAPMAGNAPFAGSERLYVLILLGKGPIHAVEDVRLNGQPITNFVGATYEVRLGTTPQNLIQGFNCVANTTSLQIDFSLSPYTYTTASAVDAFEVLVTVPGLFHTTADGSQRNNTTRFKIEYRVYGSGAPWTDAGTSTLTASTRSNRYETVRVEELALERYDIRASFISADETDETRDAWKPFVTGVTEERQDSRTYAGYALLAVKGIATDQINSLPTVDCIVEGMEVPTWNGSAFTAAAYTKNRAWAALEMFRNDDIGLGNYVTDTDLDLASFKTWADECDTVVDVTPDVGAPYTEPKHELSIALNQQRNAVELLTDLFSGGRAMWVLSGRQFRAVVDKWRTPVQMFTVANLSNFQISYRGEKERFNTFDVTILDDTRDWETSPFEVFDYTEVVTNGKPKRRQPLQLVGTTRRSEATREAEFRLKAQLLTRRVISFSVWLDALLAEVGDPIAISHDLPQWGYSGIVAGGTSTSIVLDRAVTIEAAKVYDVQVRWSDGTAEAGEVRRISNAPGTYTTLNVTVAFSKTPARPDMYAFGETTIVVKPFVILAIGRDGDSYRKVTAIEHLEAVYDTTGEVTVPVYSSLPNLGAPPGPIAHMTAIEEIGQRLDESWVSTIILGWPRSLPAAQKGMYGGARLERSWNGTNWEPLGFSDGEEFRWENAPHGVQVWFRAIPVSTQGKANTTAPVSVETGTVGGGATASSIPLGETVALTGGQRYLISIGGEVRIIADTLPGSYSTVTLTAPLSAAPAAATPWTILYNAGYAEQSLTTTGKTSAPDSVSSFAAASKDNAFVFTWGESVKAEWVELRTADANWGDTLPANGFVWRGKGQVYIEPSPAARTRQLYAKRVDAFGNYSVGAVTNGAGAIDAAPGAPTLNGGSVEVTFEAIIIPVTPPADTDVVAIHLHASITNGFTPSDANRVASLSGAGGKFTFVASESATWYFKAAAEDWLSQKLDDWVYCAQLSANLLVLNPDEPTGVTCVLPADTRIGIIDNGDGTLQAYGRTRAVVTWAHVGDGTNPAGSLVGFRVVMYDTVNDPTILGPVYDSGVLSDHTKRLHTFPETEFATATDVAAAVQAVYSDGLVSGWGTSLGTTVGGDDPLVIDATGKIEIPESCADFFPLTRNATGVFGTAPNDVTSGGTATYTRYIDGSPNGLLLAALGASGNKIATYDFRAWTIQNATVATYPDDRLPIRPPDPVDATQADGQAILAPFKITQTAGGEYCYVFSDSDVGVPIASLAMCGGVWIKNLNASTRLAQTYFYAPSGGGATGGHRSLTLDPGVWTHLRTLDSFAFSAGGTGNKVALVVSLFLNGGSYGLAGDKYAIALPQIETGAATLTPFTMSAGYTPGLLCYPPMCMDLDNWTVFIRYTFLPGLLATIATPGAQRIMGAMAYIPPSSVRNLFGVTEQGLHAGGTPGFQLFYWDEVAGMFYTHNVAHTYANAAERTIALRRTGTKLALFAQEQQLDEWDTTVDFRAKATTAYPVGRFIVGAKSSSDLSGAATLNAAVRNLAVFNEALDAVDVLKILRIGVNFAIPDKSRLSVPAPIAVYATEV